MSACFRAYGSDTVVSDLFSNMLNDGLFQLRILSKTRGGRWSSRTSFPGSSSTRPPWRERKRHWLGLVTCLLNFSRWQTNRWRDGLHCVFVSLSPRRPSRREPWERGSAGIEAFRRWTWAYCSLAVVLERTVFPFAKQYIEDKMEAECCLKWDFTHNFWAW